MNVRGGRVAVDPSSPNWIASDDRGIRLLGQFDGRTPFADVVRSYSARTGLDVTRAWLHVETFARDALRRRFLSTDGVASAPYLGRAAYLETTRLREFWIQVNDFCNLACEHCLVSSGPSRDQGLDTDRILRAIDQAVALGAVRVFFTGGEPLARPDIFELAEYVVAKHRCELVVLTNGTLLEGEGLDRLTALAAVTGARDEAVGIGKHSPGLRLQVSLDGSSPEVNDPIRGAGSFVRIVKGLGAAVAAGLSPTMTVTILKHNIEDIEGLVRLAAGLEVRNVHLLWPHRRGRVLEGAFADLPSADAILAAVRRARGVASELGVSIDNVEEFRLRLDGTPGIKNDLAGAAWSSLCLYTDGWIYPSASMAGVPELRCGDFSTQTLEAIWKESTVCRDLRNASVEKKSICRTCRLKFLCGGGDLEHGYWTVATKDSGVRGSFLAHDPYCELYQGLADDTLSDLAAAGRRTVQPRSGFDRPVVFRGMGDDILHEDPDAEATLVRTTHSACVSSGEVMERSRLTVRDFYGDAAEQPKAELCCPVQPDAEDLAHIPKEVVDRFYGCGSPVTAAALVGGESMVDLGSGGGIDCFIAAKKVGPKGRVYGIDMTDQMLDVARSCQPKVAQALGYDVVEFRKGYLEQIPMEDAVANVVTSNCVINLSADKPRVLREIWRVLKDHGRMVVADIVSDRDVPPKMRADGKLWGECISGALTEEAFLGAVERSGFYGVSILQKSFWKEVGGCTFSSVTVRGYKFEKKAGCEYVGQHAVYLGPQKAVVDEEGHLFPRGTPIEVCTDTALKLSNPPYTDSFAIVEGPTSPRNVMEVDDSGCGGPDCC
jgi:radical SAM protein with 4Fe4S-binding SPASM domain